MSVARAQPYPVISAFESQVSTAPARGGWHDTFGLPIPRVPTLSPTSRVVVATLAVLGSLYLAAPIHVSLYRNLLALQFNDFGKFWYSAAFHMAGGDMYAASPASRVAGSDGVFANLNPPHFHLLLLPLTALSLPAAFAVWAGVSLVSLGISLRVIVAELQLRLTPAAVSLALFAILMAGATQAMVLTGQLGWLLLLPMTLAWRYARRSRWTEAGVLFGICAAIKPFILIVLPYLLLRRRWRAAGAMTAATLASFVAGIAVFGMKAHLDWISGLGQVTWAWAAMNGSILAVVTRMFSKTPFFTPVADASGLIVPVWTASLALVGLGTLAALHRSTSVDVDLALLLLAALLMSPLGWVYYAWFCAGPLLASWKRRSFSGLAPGAAAMTVPLAATVIFHGPLATATVGSVYFWGTLLLWWASVRQTRYTPA